METIDTPIMEYGVARFVRPGETKSGDLHLVRCNSEGALVAVIDGIGHGQEAANAARCAAKVLRTAINQPVISAVENCHENLRSTRGVVMSLAAIHTAQGMMTWLGVGNVQGILVRADNRERRVQEELLLRAGVIGAQLPPLQAAVVPVLRGDTLVFATDGIRHGFIASLSALESPQRAAARILKQYGTGKDDALVLVVRITGVSA